MPWFLSRAPTQPGAVRGYSRGAFLAVTAISSSRLLIGGAFVFCALDQDLRLQRASLALMILLIVTDFIDGPIARHWKVVSQFGFVVDGIGDRALYLAALLVIGARLGMPIILIYLIVLRDIILYAARSLAPNWIALHGETRFEAKLNAGVLRAVIVLYLGPFYLAIFALPPALPPSPVVLTTIAVLYTAISYLSLMTVLHKYYRASAQRGGPPASGAR